MHLTGIAVSVIDWYNWQPSLFTLLSAEYIHFSEFRAFIDPSSVLLFNYGNGSYGNVYEWYEILCSSFQFYAQASSFRNYKVFLNKFYHDSVV